MTANIGYAKTENATGYEVCECCPHCGYENIWEDLDVEKMRYKTRCQECGREIMLCSECMYDPETGEYSGDCNWHREGKCGVCYRGVTMNDD